MLTPMDSRAWFLLGAVALATSGCCVGLFAPKSATARNARSAAKALVFHAPFDGTADARVAGGDARFQHGDSWDAPRNTRPGLPPGNVVRIDPGAGIRGDALRFDKKITQVVGFRVPGNFPNPATNGQGTVSFWLRVTPDEDIEPGYSDVIQVTSKAWDDAAFFVEFTKDEKPREMRLGIYADKKVWNPNGRDWNKMSFEEKPLARVERPGFKRDRWSHVAFTWERFNTGRPDGTARLYVDGRPAGGISPREQTFTWDEQKAVIMLGLAYTGWMDDLRIYNRALTPDEVQALHAEMQ